MLVLRVYPLLVVALLLREGCELPYKTLPLIGLVLVALLVLPFQPVALRNLLVTALVRTAWFLTFL